MEQEWLTPYDLNLARYAHLTYVEIGAETGMNPRTVKAHMDKIRKKLGVQNKRHIQDELRKLGYDLD